MFLYEIEFVSYICTHFSGFNQAYRHFATMTENAPDLSNPQHTKALFGWLDKGGCKLFTLEFHDKMAVCLHQWYQSNEKYLPSLDKNIWELEENDYNMLVMPYRCLVKIVASKKIRNGKYVRTSIGPTAATRILYALRPKSLVPLDTSRRLTFGYDGSITSYIKYLKMAKDLAFSLDRQCRVNGFGIEELTRKIERRHATIPTLIDEYHWVTITNKFAIPSKNTIKKWTDWKEYGNRTT